MKITEYPKTKELSKTDEFIIGGPDSTKAIKGEDFFTALDEISTDEPAVSHRNHFRGKNLGSAFTIDQKEAIRNGSFKDLWVGDYWESQGHKWRIVDINYYYGTLKDTNKNILTDSHILVAPDDSLYTSVWDSNTPPTGGYLGSNIKTTGLNQAKTMFSNLFGSECILSHYDVFTNSSSGNAGTVTDVDLFNRDMFLGDRVYKEKTAWNNPWSEGCSYKQCSLFKLNPYYLWVLNQHDGFFWSRDIDGIHSNGNYYIWGFGNGGQSVVGFSYQNTVKYFVRPYALIG